MVDTYSSVRTWQMCANAASSYFPYSTPRPGQLTLIRAIQEYAAVGTHLCVEAANGFGKTIAALSGVLPLLKTNNYGIVYIARTHKQLDRVMHELRLISESTGLNGVVLRGRAVSCLNPLIQRYASNAQQAMFICFQLRLAGRCEFYQNLLKKTKRNRNYYTQFYKVPLTGSELRQKCLKERVCPYELTKRILPFVTVVATTYFQIFDPQIHQSFLEAFARPFSNTILIIDEAHNLPRIAVELASAKLSLNSIRQARREAKRYDLHSVVTFCNKLDHVIQKLLETHSEQEIKLDPKVFNTQISKSIKSNDLETFSTKLLQLGDKLIKKLLTEGLAPISYIYSLGRFFVKWSNSLHRSDSAYFIVRNESKRNSARLELIALDPRCATVTVFEACHSSVHLSGTLQPISAHIDLVGLPKGTQVLNLPSPFSPNQIFPVISLGVTTAMKYRTPRMFTKITRRIVEVCQATTHNVGIFVPSYSVLQSLLNSGLASQINRELFVEKPGSSSNENDAMIQAYKARADAGAALLGVLSGRNSEGEDYPGREMQTVIVVGVPYPRPNPIEATRIDYFEQQFPGKGRLYGYQLPALRSASQAAGRSVRRLDDRGAIVFLDDRYATPSCSRLLPSWIIENLKSSNDSDGVLFDKLKSFYSEV